MAIQRIATPRAPHPRVRHIIGLPSDPGSCIMTRRSVILRLREPRGQGGDQASADCQTTRRGERQPC